MAVRQQKFVLNPVRGFTLFVGSMKGDKQAKLRILDSHGWEFLGMGFNTGGRWRWKTTDVTGVSMVLDNRKTYDGGLTFANLTGKWGWSTFVAVTGPSEPWFSRGDSGTIEIPAIARFFLQIWWME